MKGDINMSHSNIATNNKQQKHPKVPYEQYLYNSGEPEDDVSHDTTQEHQARLQEQADRYYMITRRRILRRDAQRMRIRYS